MDEENQTHPATVADKADVPAVALPVALDLNELQALAPAGLEEVCRAFEVRMHPGRNRHQHIVDLVRAACSRNIPVTVEGFFAQIADSSASSAIQL